MTGRMIVNMKALGTKHVYDSRLINKLQNGAIPLILKTWKIQGIHFVRDYLILNRHGNFSGDNIIIVTLLQNNFNGNVAIINAYGINNASDVTAGTRN